MRSIRRFLIIVLIATITLVNFVAALHGYRSSMANADRLFDAQLEDIAGVLATLTSEGDELQTDSDVNAIAFQVWRNESLIAASPNAPAEPLAPLETGFSDVNFGGYRWRAYARPIPESGVWLIVAERDDLRFTVAESVIIESVLPIILGLPIVSVLVWVIVGRGLQPLRRLADDMRTKRSDDLTPITETAPPREMAVLIDSINDLLARLDASFERERRLAADAAHELRTPIAVLKVELHNLLQEAETYQPQLRDLEACVERMSHSVEQVLMLYRTSPDQFIARFSRLDLAGIAREVIAELYPQIKARSQSIELVANRADMQGDRFALKTLLANLIGNASKYGNEGGEIRVTLLEQPNAIQLTVEDNGPGIPADIRERVFERFYRGDGEEADIPVEGSGIGLAIVRHVADIHGASITLRDADFETGLAVEVTFPLRQSGKRTRAAS